MVAFKGISKILPGCLPVARKKHVIKSNEKHQQKVKKCEETVRSYKEILRTA